MVAKAIQSVLDQTYRNFEIVLVNDGSTDESAEVLRGFSLKYPDKVRVISKHNEGAGLARETGRLVARGEFIQYLDSDDWLLPSKFAVQVKALKEHPGHDIAYGISRQVNSSGKTLKEPSKWTGKKFEYLFPALLIDRWWHTSTPLYTRRISDLAGPWPRQRPEDWDLEARMGAHHAKLVYCPEPVSCYHQHDSGDRITGTSHEKYLLDQAWFLPRLYQCALTAGIQRSSPEMQYFSRSVFLSARQLGCLGKSKHAWKLLTLSDQSASKRSLSLIMVKSFAKILGWKLTGSLCGIYEKVIKYRFHSNVEPVPY